MTTPNIKGMGSKSGVKRTRTASARDAFDKDTVAEQDRSKRTKAVSVYMTPEEHRAFRMWAFEREESMSDVLSRLVPRILSGEVKP